MYVVCVHFAQIYYQKKILQLRERCIQSNIEVMGKMLSKFGSVHTNR